MKFIKLGLVAAALMTVSGVSLAQQKDIKIVDPRESPYVISPNGVVVMNPFGLCWRTGFWTLERAATTKIEGAPFPNWTVGCEPVFGVSSGPGPPRSKAAHFQSVVCATRH